MLPEDREFYIEKFKEAEESKTYFLYGLDPKTMTLEELKDKYMTMVNYLSDTRTHTDW